jgi:hypothetical protein
VQFCFNLNGNTQANAWALYSSTLGLIGGPYGPGVSYPIYLQVGTYTIGICRISSVWNSTSAILTYSTIPGEPQVNITADNPVNGVCPNSAVTFTANATNFGSSPTSSGE